MSQFTIDSNGESIRAWAYRRRATVRKLDQDAVRLTPTYTGKKPKSGRLGRSWDEAENRGLVKWRAIDKDTRTVIRSGDNFTQVVEAAGGRVATTPAEQAGVAAPGPVGTAESYSPAALRARADQLEEQANALRQAADLMDRVMG